MAKSESSSTSLSPDWAYLPVNLLDSILEKLVPLSDFIRFSAVCKPWNSIASNHKEKRIRLSNHKLPWLLTSSRDNHEGEEKLRIYDYFRSETLDFQLRIPKNMFQGCSHGWLIFAWRYLNSVVNPLSGVSFPLPPFTGPEHRDAGKIILSRDPSLGSFDVLSTFPSYYDDEVVAYLRYGDEDWTYSETRNGFSMFCFTFYKDRILGASNGGGIVSLEVISNESDSSRSIKIEEMAPDFEDLVLDEYSDCSTTNLVETTNGDLIMVLVNLGLEFGRSVTYKIYKLVDLNGKLKRIPVVNLGGHSLFLGCNYPISVLASDFPGCKPNSIYHASLLCDPRDFRFIYEIQEYNLEDKSVRKDRSLSTSFLGAWIVPSMNLRKEI